MNSLLLLNFSGGREWVRALANDAVAEGWSTHILVGDVRTWVRPKTASPLDSRVRVHTMIDYLAASRWGRTETQRASCPKRLRELAASQSMGRVAAYSARLCEAGLAQLSDVCEPRAMASATIRWATEDQDDLPHVIISTDRHSRVAASRLADMAPASPVYAVRNLDQGQRSLAGALESNVNSADSYMVDGSAGSR